MRPERNVIDQKERSSEKSFLAEDEGMDEFEAESQFIEKLIAVMGPGYNHDLSPLLNAAAYIDMLGFERQCQLN